MLRCTVAVLAMMSLLQQLQAFQTFGGAQQRTARLNAVNSNDFSALERKLLEKGKAVAPASVPTQTPKTANKVAEVKATANKVVEKKVEKKEEKKIEKPVEKKVEAAKVAPAVQRIVPVQQQAKTTTTVIQQPTTPSDVSALDYFVGISLGVAPYLLLPVVAFNAVKGLFSKPKPLPKPDVKPPKRVPYSKPLGEGVKEGIDELLSGKVTPDLELTRKGIKLSASAFAIAGVLTGALFVTSPPEKTAEVNLPDLVFIQLFLKCSDE